MPLRSTKRLDPKPISLELKDPSPEKKHHSLTASVQVQLELSPYKDVTNEVSFMLNKTQARMLVRTLQAALKADSHYCMEVIRTEGNVIVRNLYTRDEGMSMLTGVNAKIILDNY